MMEADEFWVSRKLGRVCSCTFTSRLFIIEVEVETYATAVLARTKALVLIRIP
jgi:hypothetical protein